MTSKGRILYAEDDEVLAFVTKDNLELEGYDITHCINGVQAYSTFKSREFDLCVLDVMMPEMDGFTLGDMIRKSNHHIPIIFLTAKSLKEDKIKGLKLGGDDYITKPFSIEELILKIKIFMKRKNVNQPQDKIKADEYEIGKYYFNYKNLFIRFEEKNKQLTQKEADLLQYLISNQGEIVKRGDILKEIWGEDDYFLGRSLDVFISRLRKYLKEDPEIEIRNIHGVGFKLMIKLDKKKV